MTKSEYNRLKERLTRLKKERSEYVKANRPRAFKSKTVKCPRCGSVINTQYIVEFECPVCDIERIHGKLADRMNTSCDAFMSKTTREVLDRYDTRIRDAESKIYAAECEKPELLDPYARAERRILETLEDVYETVKGSDFTEFRGTTGGDMRCFRVYRDGSVHER